LKSLDLTGASITSLEGLPLLPRLTSLILNQTGLTNLKNILSAPKLRVIALKKTPFSQNRFFRISLVIALPSDLVKIDEQAVPKSMKKRAREYPSCAGGLVNAGWIAEWPKPSTARFTELCAEYGVSESRSVGSSGCADIAEEVSVQVPSEFEPLAEQLMKDHEHLIHKKQALFGIIEEPLSEDEAIDECRVRVGELFRERGIAVDVNDDEAILQMIDDLCTGRLPFE
jgi:hypothetical protein